jgi:hypothetical protein
MSKVWIDVLTPKQVHYFHRTTEGLEKKGHEIVITARHYDSTIELLESMDIAHRIVGGHGGGTLGEKLKASLRRQIHIQNFLQSMKQLPDWSLSLCSPEAARIAYGLGIRVLLSNDAPHAEAVSRLTLPLADRLVAPKCIPKAKFTRYGIEPERIRQYDGIDEVAWIRDLRPDESSLALLGLRDRRFVVLRPEETKAAYLLDTLQPSSVTVLRPMIEKLIQLHLEVAIVVLPRYPDQRDALNMEFGDRIVIPDRAIEGPSVMAYADLVVSGGGTMSREASLLGTPAICAFPKGQPDVERFLIERGFPLQYIKDIEEATETALQILADPEEHRMETYDLLREMESPVETITETVTE